MPFVIRREYFVAIVISMLGFLGATMTPFDARAQTQPSTAPASTQPVELMIDAALRHQTIEGFGTCLAWWMYDQYASRPFRNLYFNDLGCSILRMEFHPNALARVGTKKTRNEQPVRFTDSLEDNVKLFNLGADGVRNYVSLARAGPTMKLDEFKLIGSLWTPPHFMKDGAKVNSFGQSCGGHLKMDDDTLEQFGRYVAAFVTAVERGAGVPVHAISIQNELRFSQGFNSCAYTPEQYVKALKAVGREFKRNQLATKILGPEDVGVGPDDKDFFLKSQMKFIDAVRADPEAASYLDIYCIHGYTGNGTNESGGGRDNWRRYWRRIARDEKQSWMTETSGENPWNKQWTARWKGRMNGGLQVANAIHEALVYGSCSAYVYWLLTEGKNDYAHTALTGGADATKLKYCAAKHYFRTIRPGAVRIDAGPDDADGVNVSAFVHDRNGTLTVVLVNMAKDERPVTCALKGLDRFTTFSGHRTSRDEAFVSVPELRTNDGRLTFVMPPHSVVTLESPPRAATTRPTSTQPAARRRQSN